MALVTAGEVRVGKGRDKDGKRKQTIYPGGTRASELPKKLRDQLRAADFFISEERWTEKQIAAGFMQPEDVFNELDELDALDEEEGVEEDEAEEDTEE